MFGTSNMKPSIFSLRLRRVTKLHPTVAVLTFESPANAPALDAGVFFMLEIPDESICFRLGRPFSIMSWTDNVWEFLIQGTGRGSKAFINQAPGSTVIAMGPFGCPFVIPENAHKVLLVSGGVGVATLYPLHRNLVERGIEVHHIYGARNQELLVCSKELASLGGRLTLATDDGSYGLKGRLDQVLATHPEWLENNDVTYTCGPLPMLKAVYETVRSLWKGPLFTSMEVRMGCGYGVCRGCAIPLKNQPRYAMACLEGPTFSMDEVDWSCLMNP